MRIVLAFLVAGLVATSAILSQQPAGERDVKKPEAEPRTLIPGLRKATDNVATATSSPENLPAYFRTSIELRTQLADFRDLLSKRAGWADLGGLATGKAVIKGGRRQNEEPRDPAQDQPKGQDPKGSPNLYPTAEEIAKMQRRNDWVTFDPLARHAERQLLALDTAMVAKAPNAEAIKQALTKLHAAVKEMENAANPPRGKLVSDSPPIDRE